MEQIKYCLSQFKKNIFDPSTDKDELIPNIKGVYLICIKDITEVPKQLTNVHFSRFNEREVLYVGISGDRGLRKRDYRNHFNGSARNSTLRKSIGVLFGYAKVHSRNEAKSTKYRFDKDSELRLSRWMKTNLIMHYCTAVDNVDNVESMLIEAFNPPFNLSKNKNETNKEFRKYLSELRCSV